MDGKVEMRGMTLVEVVVATALFAIFLCIGLGLLQLTMGQYHSLERRRAAQDNAQVMADFLAEEIGLAESVCILVDWDGSLVTLDDEVDLRHPRHNLGVGGEAPTGPKLLRQMIFEYGTDKVSRLVVRDGQLRYQGEVVGSGVEQISVSCDEEVRLVTFSLKVEGADQAIQVVQDLGFKK